MTFAGQRSSDSAPSIDRGAKYLALNRNAPGFAPFKPHCCAAKGECRPTGFNRVGVVGRALDSVRAQTFEDYEIIVVDDGSTDGSADFVQSLGISKIRVIRCPENRGAAAARNLSVAAASGHYIAFLDSDDSWEPNKLALQVAALENAAPGFLACGTDFYLWHEGPRTLVRTGLTPAKFRKDILFGCSISPGSTLMVAREAFEKVGSFNELLRRLEDWDWLLRFRSRLLIFTWPTSMPRARTPILYCKRSTASALSICLGFRKKAASHDDSSRVLS